jgi:hypothetical protein
MEAILTLLTSSASSDDGYTASMDPGPIIITAIVVLAVMCLVFFATYSRKCGQCCNRTQVQSEESEVE